MSNPFFHKPDLALRRALELESINQSQAALSLLHEVLSSRRHRTWSPTYENIMMTYLNLCLKLHKSREAKDGLHQYRNLSQSQAPGSLEKVIRYLMDQAELKCSQATKTAEKLAQSKNDDTLKATIDELNVSPQAILMSTMSADPGKSQRDSTLLLPSLKFLWETYRAVLDILKSNSKLEHVYHVAAIGALRFCRTYKRRTEFRRLCDMLRMHLGNLQKYGSMVGGIEVTGENKTLNGKIRGWDGWTNESIELHLQTRFSQLETASVLHLYTEGFRTVEDIYNILQISHARRKTGSPPPKAKLMAAYYEKLTTLFWVSENYLFHAFAWYKYYTLCCEFHRGMSEETKQRQASAVLLATLCIPAAASTKSSKNTNQKPTAASANQQHGITSTVEDDIYKEKMARMATLLGFHTRHPTRESLLNEIKSKSIMDQVPAYLKELYLLFEENSDPLIMVKQAHPLLEKLRQEVGATNVVTDVKEEDDEGKKEESVVDASKSSATLGRYVQPLTSVLLLKLLMNLSAAYHTVSMDHLRQLTSGLKDVTFDQIEKAMVLFTHDNISLKIDHRAGCLRFGDPELESEAMRYQLTTLSKQLQGLVQNYSTEFDNTAGSLTAPVMAVEKASFYQGIRDNLVPEHEAIVARKHLIEKRKEELERLTQEKIKEKERLKRAEEAARKAEELKRRERDQRLREKEKLEKIDEELRHNEKVKYLVALGHNVEQMSRDEIANTDIRALQKKREEKVNKKRMDAERKQREAAKRLDYLVRAIRIEELPLIQKAYEEKIASDKKRYEQKVIEKAERAKKQWEADVKEKEIFHSHSVFGFLDEFESKVMTGRTEIHKKLCCQEDTRAELEAEKGKLRRARRRKEEESERIALEEKMRQEEAEQARLAAEKAAREEQRAAEEATKRQAEETRMREEQQRKESEKGRYLPPSRRGQHIGGSRFDDRPGGAYGGGGRYERRDGWGSRDGGGSGSGRRGGFNDRDRGYSDRRSGGGGYSDRDRSGGSGYGDRDRSGGYGDRRDGSGYGNRMRDDRGRSSGGGSSDRAGRRW